MENTNFHILDNEIIKIYNNDLAAINIVGININEEKQIVKENDKDRKSVV